MEKNNVPLPPVSNVSDKEEKEIINRGILNDVATCWYIIGRSYEGRGHRYKHEAIQAYSKVAQFSHALTYDPNGDHFWSPAQAAIARASLLENSKIAKSTPNTTIESAKEPSDLNEINTNQPAGVSKENLNDKIVVAEKLPDKKENKEMFEKQRVYPPNEKQYSNILAPEERFPANLVFQEDQQVECELVGFEHPSGTFGIPPREKGPIFLYYLKLDTMPDGHYSVDTTGGRGVKAHFKDIKLILFDERVGKNFRKVVIEYKYGIKERGYTFNNLSFSCCNKKTNDYFKVSTEQLNQVIFK